MALKKIEGVDKVMLSGMTAFVTTTGEDVKMTRSTLRKAFDASGIKVERVRKMEIPAPKEAYDLAITGGT
ncbi:MAG: hypothetical protein ACJAQT_002121 [Akkermansiaceae bacterium]